MAAEALEPDPTC